MPFNKASWPYNMKLPSTTGRIRACLLALTLAASASHATQAESDVHNVRGVRFPDHHEVGSQSLQLNGAGVRVKFIISIYAAGLYLPRRESSLQAILSMPGAKSMQAVMLRDVTADDFVNAMIKGFKSNNSDDVVARYLPKLEELGALMSATGSAKKGTTVHIDYLPGSGTQILVDGQRKAAPIPGEEFYEGLLKIWLGNHPADSDLKAALLGGK